MCEINYDGVPLFLVGVFGTFEIFMQKRLFGKT